MTTTVGLRAGPLLRTRTFKTRTWFYPLIYRYDCFACLPQKRWLMALREIAAPGAPCANTKKSTMMRLKVRVLSRTYKALKNMRKINLVPGRGLELREFPQEFRGVTESRASLTRQITRYRLLA
jgi:hypothetical protein